MVSIRVAGFSCAVAMLWGCGGSSPDQTHGVGAANAGAPGDEVSASHATSAKQIASGDSHTCAVMTDGTVRCWGLGSGLPSSTTESIPMLNGAVAVTSGTLHSCALLDDGTVRCWQGNGDETSPDVSDAKKITAGNSHTCALLAGGTVRCWGDNSAGELIGVKPDDCPSGSYLDCLQDAITVPGLPAIVDVAAGGTHTCALDGMGSVWCWGSDFYGEVTDRKTELCPTGFEDACFTARKPTQVLAISGAIQIAAGSKNSCALMTNGTVRCWGASNGSDPQPGSSTISIDGVSDAVSLSTGDLNTCVILSNRSVKCWGAIDSNLDGVRNDQLLAALNDVVQISAGGQHVCALSSDGTARGWGLDGQRQIDGMLPSGCTSLEDQCFIEVTQIPF